MPPDRMSDGRTQCLSDAADGKKTEGSRCRREPSVCLPIWKERQKERQVKTDKDKSLTLWPPFLSHQTRPPLTKYCFALNLKRNRNASVTMWMKHINNTAVAPCDESIYQTLRLLCPLSPPHFFTPPSLLFQHGLLHPGGSWPRPPVFPGGPLGHHGPQPLHAAAAPALLLEDRPAEPRLAVSRGSFSVSRIIGLGSA